MDWEQTTADDDLTEWTREDGHATIRLRERADGSVAVRFDRLHQAAEGRGYAFEVLAERDAAEKVVDDWQTNDPVD